jgi:DNA-binding transcriptional LysR family regulator
MASISIVDGIDVSSLRLFLSVVELGSVSKAAQRHQVAQPSATAKLHKLERQLGVQLLDRGPSGSSATADGGRLAASCAEVIAGVVALVDRAEMLRADRRRLTIATTRHVADHFLPAWISACELDEVRVELVEADTLSVAQAVRAGEAVLGFTEGPAAPLAVRSEVVGGEQVVAVVGRSHEWYRRRRPLSAREVGRATLVLGRRGSGTRDVVEAAMAPLGLGEEGGQVEVSSSAGARLAALSGVGVAFLPRCRVGPEVRNGDLRVVRLADVRIDQPIRVIWRGARPADAAARQLLEHLRVRAAAGTAAAAAGS